MQKKTIAACVVAVLGALYAGAGFWGVPYVIDKAMKRYAPRYISRQVSAEKIFFNPFTLRLSVENLLVTERDRKTPFVTLKRFDTSVQWTSLMKLAPMVDHLSFDTLVFRLKREKMLRFNVSDLLRRYLLKKTKNTAAQSGSAFTIPAFMVEKISLKNSSLEFTDRVRGKKDTIDRIDFDLPLVTSFKENVSVPIAPHLAFRLNGEPFDMSMQSIPFHQTMKTGVDFAFKNLDLANLATFIPLKLNANLDRAKLDATINLAFIQEGDVPRLRLKGKTLIHDLTLSNRQEEASDTRLMDFKTLEVDIEELVPFGQSVKVSNVKFVEPSICVVKENNGTLNWLNLLNRPIKNKKGKTVANDPGSGASPWKWSVDRIELERAKIQLMDRSVGFEENFGIETLSVGPVENTLSKVTHVALKADPLGSDAAIQSDVTIKPLTVSAEINVSGVNLGKLNAYVTREAKAKIASGLLSVNGRARLNADGTVRVNADLDSTGFSIVETNGKKLFDFAKLGLKGLELDQGSSLTVRAKDVLLDKPTVSAVISKDGQLNWNRILAKKNTKGVSNGAVKNAKAKSSEPTVYFDIGKIDVRRGSAQYYDSSVKPYVGMNLKRFNLSAKHVANIGKTRAQFNASGDVNSSRLKVTGSGVPKNGEIDIATKIKLDTLMLPTLSAYSDRYTGHAIRRGNLSYEGDCKISKRTVDMSNVFMIDQLEFKDGTPNAKTTYPMPLVAALLRDRAGRIDLDIPVYGSYDDPDFSIAGTVFRVIGNLIVKAVTSPFSLIGSMFGSENLDLSQIGFKEGGFDAAAIDVKTAEALTKVLTDRPGLKVRLLGGASAELDGPTLKANALTHMCRLDRELEPKEELTQKARNRAIERLFKKTKDDKKPDLDDVKQKEAYLLGRIELKDEWLNNLAMSRSTALRNYLVEQGKIESSRIFIDNENSGANSVKIEIQ